MSNLKTLTTMAIATFITTPVFAQDAEQGEIFDTAPDAVASDFASADLDQDGGLNADEFVTFAVMRAKGGDEAFKDIVMGGEYGTIFQAHDADASGSIEANELTRHHQEKSEPEILEPETEDIIEPDM